MGTIDGASDELARFLRQLGNLHEIAAILKEAGGLENFVAEKRKILEELEAEETSARADLADITTGRERVLKYLSSTARARLAQAEAQIAAARAERDGEAA